MEIIKEPNMQTVCHKCGCEFKFNKNDVKLYGGSGRKGSWCYHGVICPICNTKFEVWKKEGEF